MNEPYRVRHIARKKTNSYHWRYCILLILIGLIFTALIGRMVYLMVIDKPFLQQQGDARVLRTIEIPAYRGMITDRNGEPLAVSSPVDDVWVNPQSFYATPQQLHQLANILEIPTWVLSAHINKNKKRGFLYLKRQIPPFVADQIDKLSIDGLFMQRTYRRYYPEGEVTAHIVGLTNIDDQGQEGLELQYNSILSGVPGLRKVIKDRLGNVVQNVSLIRDPKPGADIALSIDRRIQYIAYRDLKNSITEFGAQSGSIIVMSVKTGEVLAMANVPSYNPNNRPAIHDGRFRNRAVTDIFEPGSTMKTFAVTLSLMSGKFTPQSKINTSPGWTIISGHRVQDENNEGLIDVGGVLKYSSNVGVSKMILTLPRDALWQFYDKVGLGHSTDSGFPGESAGELPFHPVWNPFVVSTMSFGYALTVTLLQLAHFYTILANYGVEVPVSLRKIDTPPGGREIFPADIAKQVITMLETVVEPGGTATKAHVDDYWVAGKTGTSRLVGTSGYEWNHHNSLFVGMAPASKPEIIVAVYIRDPTKINYFGGEVAAPVFAQVMSGALRILDIPPDHLRTPDQKTQTTK